MRYTFYIGNVGAETQVYPLSTFGLRIVQVPYEEKLFFEYHKELNKEIIFDNRSGDYDLIVSLYALPKIRFAIKLGSELQFEGYFNRLNVEDDPDAKTISVKPEVDTIFEDIKAEWNKTYNALDIATDIDTLASTVQYATRFEFKADIPTNPPDYYYILKSFTSPDTAVYAREVSDYRIDETYLYDPIDKVWYKSWEASNPFLYNFVYRNPADTTGLTYINTVTAQTHYYDASEIIYVTQYTTIPNGRRLEAVIKFLFGKITATTMYSTLFFGDNDEFGNTATNYVDSGKDLTELRLHQLSDVKNPFATEAATKMEVSLQDILNDLNIMFGKVGLFIDSDGNLRLEHVHYFEQPAFNNNLTKIDLNLLTTASGVKYVGKKNKSKINEEEFANYETFKYVANERGFNNALLRNVGVLTKEVNRESQTKRIVSDWEGLIINPKKFSEELIMCFITDSNDRIFLTENQSDGIDYYNGYLDFAYLCSKYHKNDRPTTTTIINDVEYISPLTIMKAKEQAQITVPQFAAITKPTEINPIYQKFKTELNQNKIGNDQYGVIGKCEYDLSTDYITLNLLFVL
jgi:hypothetical protein